MSQNESINADPATASLLQAEADSTKHEQPTKPSERSALLVGGDVEADATHDEEEEEEQLSCCKNPCGVMRYYKKMFVISAFAAMVSITTTYTSLLPKMKKDYFGGAQEAAVVQSYFDTSTAVVGIFTAFTYGKLQDTIGRKPFFVVFTVLQTLLPVLLLIFPKNPLPFMGLNVVARLCPHSFLYAFLSDHFPVAKRSFVFAFVAAMRAIANIASLMVVGMPHQAVVVVCAIFGGLNLLFAIFGVRESLDPALAKRFSCSTVQNPIKPLRNMMKIPMMRFALLGAGCLMFAAVGSGEILRFYLLQRVNMGDSDFAMMGIIDSFGQLLALLVFLPVLLRFLSDITIINGSIFLIFVNLVFVATVWAKWVVFAIIVPLAAVGEIINPVFLAAITTADPLEQAQRVTSFIAVGDLMSAISPLIFAQIYDHVHGGWIAIPFIIAGVICLPAIFFILKMKNARDANRAEARLRTTSTIQRARGLSQRSRGNSYEPSEVPSSAHELAQEDK